ncbi:MAG: DNA polymerase II large subunit [Thermoplasmata archaeon]
MEEYFSRLDAEVDRAYGAAERARAAGIDPEPIPEIPRAQDMAMRVEKLLAHLPLAGISGEIRELGRDRSREEVAVEMARRLARDTSRAPSLEARLDMALRVGLAILTEGILVAPLEGLAEVHVRDEGGQGAYLELYYAGPIRAAGGTAQALSVLLADLVRRDCGLGPFVPQPAEIERYKEELPLYKHLQHLQYVPTAEEIELVVRNVPVCISGESTEADAEVSAFRDLPRVGTNGIRGGACLVLAEGICQKAAKLRKVVDRLQIPGWEFLERIGRQKGVEVPGSAPPKYLSDALGGRPILAYPHRPGGFRLLYGRTRTGGIASLAVNPATMVILRNFVAVGTQVKIEYPGKATAMGLCDTIEGPLVELDDGTVIGVHDRGSAEELLARVRRILDLGELLVPYGEFLENNHLLEPGGFDRMQYLEARGRAGGSVEAPDRPPSYEEAVAEARRFGIPLHPRFNLFWHDLSVEEIRRLSESLAAQGRWIDGRLRLPRDAEFHELLVRLGVPHAPGPEGTWVIEELAGFGILGGLGLAPDPPGIARITPVPEGPTGADPLALVSRLAGVEIRARAPSRIGGRVGRPEKARQRKLTPNVHALFPVGEAGGPHRSVAEAARRSIGQGVPTALGTRLCPACGTRTLWPKCSCGASTTPTGEVGLQSLPVAALWAAALDRLHLNRVPEVKGVKGLISRAKVPERLEKGVLRAFHGVSVYQDGTARFDLTDLPLTHFRPAEIGLPVVSARAMGYTTDVLGEPLTQPDQLVELAVQDVVVATSCGQYLTRLAQFVDDELVRLYGVEPFYRARRPEDLLGAILIALAPHTSGGVAGRLIGYTEAEACFAHPLFHAAKRRNCDGDEDSVTLLLDGLLNFSRSYLPESRGALMDKPLVLTTRLDPKEVDKEAHNLDIDLVYPPELYRAADAHRPPKEVEPVMDTVGHHLGGDRARSGYGFTHDTEDVAAGPVFSAYREAGSMNRIVEQSLMLTTQLRAVDVADAVALVLNSHFLPDLMGNLKSFATQKFRCKACGTSFRRPPLSGRCTQSRPGAAAPCGAELLPTVFEGAVRKYLGLSQRLADTPGVTPYLRQRLHLLESSLSTLFPGSNEQTVLESFPASHEGERTASPERSDGSVP